MTLSTRYDNAFDRVRCLPACSTTPPVTSMIGLIDNAKIGTERFYDFLEDILREKHGVREFIRRRKPDATRPAPPEILAQVSGADAIISGIGD